MIRTLSLTAAAIGLLVTGATIGASSGLKLFIDGQLVATTDGTISYYLAADELHINTHEQLVCQADRIFNDTFGDSQ